MGWINKADLSNASSVRQVIVEGDINLIAVTGTATLREALSRMLGQGFKHIPVVDENKQLIGEVALGDVEAATAEVENNHE